MEERCRKLMLRLQNQLSHRRWKVCGVGEKLIWYGVRKVGMGL